jgi:hypothetical protein
MPNQNQTWSEAGLARSILAMDATGSSVKLNSVHVCPDQSFQGLSDLFTFPGQLNLFGIP